MLNLFLLISTSRIFEVKFIESISISKFIMNSNSRLLNNARYFFYQLEGIANRIGVYPKLNAKI